MAARIYLAGPEVFLEDQVREAVFADKRAICAQHGFQGVSPLDGRQPESPLEGTELGLFISQRNEELMCSCDALVANLTPFRGPSADVGTAFELGFMRARKRPVLAYTNTTELYLARCARAYGARRVGKRWQDASRLRVEDYGLHDNLMLEGAIHSAGFRLELHEVPETALYTSLDGFEACVRSLAEHPGADL